MKPAASLLSALLAARCSAASVPEQDASADADLRPPQNAAYLFSNPSPADASAAGLRIPTPYESAVLGRRILALAKLGTIATVFPPDSHSPSDSAAYAYEKRPAGLGGLPHGLPEYVANCEDEGHHGGDPTLLAITIATSFRNAAAGSNVSLAVQWTPPYPPATRIKSVDSEAEASSRKEKKTGLLAQVPLVGDLLEYFGAAPRVARNEEDDDDGYDPTPYSAANLPRFSLLGHVEPIPGGDDLSRPGGRGAALAACFVAAHPDAKYWLPGSRVHESHFVRLVVEQVYWIGGFGDRAYIGWIPVEDWRNVTREEWESVRLPGEKKGWKEGAVRDGEL